MDNREVMGSWLSGPRATAEQMGVEFGYRGERLGLPKEGPGSIAPTGRRLAAVFIDWMLCLVIAYGLLAHGHFNGSSPWTLAVFAVLSVLTVGTIGSTPGKRVMRLRVVRLDGTRLGLLAVAVRTALLVIVVPALIWDRDTRGLHDKAVNAVEIRI
ncbi:RDD family protein [Streptomyces sp. NPDC051976]|uniref:RDD family protein n=1 Tax=Streptomyces sp. NPDC051976 TaxID=3154947 RepID=UPI003449C164